LQAAVLYGKENVKIEDIPKPAPGKGEVLVKVACALTCGTDLKVYLAGGHAKMIKPPAPFGHEFAGVIEAVGEGVEGFEEGMRVVAANSAPCSTCFYCKENQEYLCEDLLFINGAYAEYILIPKRIVDINLHIVPEGVEMHAAALTEPLACVVHGVEDCGIKMGDVVGLIGVGPIGLLFIQLLKLKGANIIAVDTQPSRLKRALEAGADATVDASTVHDIIKTVKSMTSSKQGVDVAIDATGNPRGWESAILMVRPGGVVNLFGGCPKGTTITLPTSHIHYNSIKIVATFHHTPSHIRRALTLIESGAINPNVVINAQYPLSRLVEALEAMKTRKVLKAVIRPGE